MSTKADTGILNAHDSYAKAIAEGTIDHVSSANKTAESWGNFGNAGMNFAIIEQKRIAAQKRAEEKKKKEEIQKIIKA